MSLWQFDIALTLAAPILSEAQGGRPLGLDCAIQRDLEDKPALPGTLVRGNLRHAWAELAGYGLADESKSWLGQKLDEKNNALQRGKLIFSHWFSAADTGQQGTTRHRIRMNGEGAVDHGALQVIESPFATGEEIRFCGQAWAEAADKDAAEALAHRIRKGLAWVPALGALKGAGFGRLKSVEVTAEKVDTPEAQTIAGKLFGIALTFDRPICFARPQMGKGEGNRFEAEEFVPGAALIAALAARWPADKKEAQLSRLRITHALPARPEQTGRPLAIPCSLAGIGKALCDQARVEDQPPGQEGAPCFQPDWKETVWADANKRYAWPALDRVLETRTAIEAKNNASLKSALFSIESIDTRGYEWRANVDLSDIPENELGEVQATLARLFAEGLWPLGKTDARAGVQVLSQPYPFAVATGEADQAGETVVVVLASDAELLSPLPQADDIAGPEDWLHAYGNVFAKASGQSLALTRMFTRERLAGGGYLHRRFGKMGAPYAPRLLTCAGSAFVFEVTNAAKAAKYLADWLAYGFPSPAGDDWQSSPYRRQNGYGEIALDPQLPAGDQK